MNQYLKEFESWFLKYKENESFEADLSKTNGRYNYTRTLNLWIGWKASRKSMKAIKFPDELVPEYEGDGYKSRYDAAYCNGYNEALRLVDDSITSAGYKVE